MFPRSCCLLVTILCIFASAFHPVSAAGSKLHAKHKHSHRHSHHHTHRHAHRHGRRNATILASRDDVRDIAGDAVSTVTKRFDNARFTFYEAGLGACGKTNVGSDFIVAVNPAQYEDGKHCFEMITIHYNDKTTQAQVVDLCPSCPPNALDLSQGLFSFLDSPDKGVITGEWSFGTEDAAQDNGDDQPQDSQDSQDANADSQAQEQSTTSSTEEATPTPTPTPFTPLPPLPTPTTTTKFVPQVAAVPTLEPGSIDQVHAATHRLGNLVTQGALQGR